MKANAALEAQINANTELSARHEEALKICDEDFKYKNEEMKTM